MPSVQGAFFCESFSQEHGWISFHHVVQVLEPPSVPIRIDKFALGILLAELPTSQSTDLDLVLWAPNGIIELDGKTRTTIPIPASKSGFSQIGYTFSGFALPFFGAYRLDLFFDGATEAVHSAHLVLRPPP